MGYRAYAVDQRIVSRDTALAYWALVAHVAMLVCLIRNAMDGPTQHATGTRSTRPRPLVLTLNLTPLGSGGIAAVSCYWGPHCGV